MQIVEYVVGSFLHETDTVTHVIPEELVTRRNNYSLRIHGKQGKRIEKTQEWNQVRGTWSNEK